MQEAQRAEPASSKALCLLGVVDTALGEYAVARKHFRAGEEADPSNVVLLGAWARMEALAGDLARAQALFQAAYAQNPDNIVLLQVLRWSNPWTVIVKG